MPIINKIPDKDILHLDGKAKTKLKALAGEYVDSILDEASRLEAATDNGIRRKPKITTDLLQQASLYYRRAGAKRKKSLFQIAVIGISTLSSIYLGSLLDIGKFNDPLHVALFIITSFIVLLTTVHRAYTE